MVHLTSLYIHSYIRPYFWFILPPATGAFADVLPTARAADFLLKVLRFPVSALYRSMVRAAALASVGQLYVEGLVDREI